jgi:4-hydroxybenzoate polyprenyltransferase
MKVSSLAEKIITKIESVKISAFALALYLSILIFIRALLEQWFFQKEFNIYQLAHHFFFFVFLISGILIISSLAQANILKVTLIVSSGLIVIVLPPLIDYFIFQRSVPYAYILPKDFLKNFASYFLFTSNIGRGIMLEVTVILLMASFYVWIKSRSLLRAVFTGISLYVLIGIAGTPRLFLLLPDTTDPVMSQAKHIIYFFIYFTLAQVIGLFFLYKVDKKLPAAVFQELTSFRTLHFVLMVNAGVYLNKALDFLYFPDILYILSSNILIVLLWLHAILINNVYDLEIDRISNPNRPLPRGDVNPSQYLGLSSILSVVCLFVSLVLGIIPFLLTLLFLLSALAYSKPPLRLRRKIWGSVFIGWGSILAFFIGYTTRTKFIDLTLPNDVLSLSILIFVAFSIGPLTKDLKDYAGDSRNNVRTIFSVLGIPRGIKIVTFLLGISLLMPLILFHKWQDVAVLGLLAIFFSSLFYRKKNIFAAYSGYSIVFLYCAIRMLGWI